MEKIIFGNTGLKVSKMCLGTMTFGETWGFGSDEKEAGKILDYYLDNGGNFIDTADKYTDGDSERILGKFLKERRRRCILSTKYSLLTDEHDANSFGNHRKNLVLSVEDSLKRLKTDYIDLLWIHTWYFENQVEDVVRAIDDLVRLGKVLYWGISDSPAWLCSEAHTISKYRGWTPLSAIQIEYSLIQRTSERELYPFAEHNNIGVTGWAPLSGGLLTGKHFKEGHDVDSKRIDRALNLKTERNERILESLITLAKEMGITPAQLALAWLHAYKPNHVSIIGARKIGQLKDNLSALQINIPKEIIEKLDAVSQIELGFPHDMVNGERMQKVMYGSFK